MAVENAAGEPMAEVERMVMSMTGRATCFPLDISTFTRQAPSSCFFED